MINNNYNSNKIRVVSYKQKIWITIARNLARNNMKKYQIS